VDSGNLLASLWTLEHGCLDRLRQPLLQPCLADGLLDHLRALAELRVFPRKQLAQYEANFRNQSWPLSILGLQESDFENHRAADRSGRAAETGWFRQQAQLRLRNILQMTESYEPWWLPEFAPLRDELGLNATSTERLSLEQLPDLIRQLQALIDRKLPSLPEERRPLFGRLKTLLAAARSNAVSLVENLRSSAPRLANSPMPWTSAFCWIPPQVDVCRL